MQPSPKKGFKIILSNYTILQSLLPVTGNVKEPNINSNMLKYPGRMDLIGDVTLEKELVLQEKM